LSRYLTIGIIATLVFAFGCLALAFRTQSQAAHLKPLVIRIDQVGRADAIAYDATTYRPQVPELRYFLTRFVVTHFSRIRASVLRDYPDSLFFLSPTLADLTIASNERTHVLDAFMKDATADDIEVTVKNVTLTELTTSPFHAAVDFDQTYYPQNTRQARKHDISVAQIDFTLRDQVPNTFIPINPLGLQITNLHVDQAF
jgi:type IV secretory pathway TrbF-like protein